mgnify:CR=1 FL=1
MCGIAGIIDKRGNNVSAQAIKAMIDTIAHRGPDANGIFTKNNVALGHCRLSIVDLSDKGAQPMFSCDKKLVLTFNGEIYNYIELKAELRELGADFSTETDSEVIIEAYRFWGTDCVKKFNGMWSFALYDIEKQNVFLSRDRFGVKPLYILDRDDIFAFASEIKGITSVYPEEKRVDLVEVTRYMRLITEDLDDHTFYAGIKNFPAASSMMYSLQTNRRSLQQYWKVDVQKCREKYGGKNRCRQFRNIFEDAIRIRQRADVEVGASLSGGLDSSAIVCVSKKKFGIGMQTFSAVYDEKECDEKIFIDCVNEEADSKRHYIYPSKSEDIISDLKQLTYFHDGPCISASPYSGFCVYRGVEGRVKVLLDGQGADELFGGYYHFYDSRIKDILSKGTMLSRLKAVSLIAKYVATWPNDLMHLSESAVWKALGSFEYKKYLMNAKKQKQTPTRTHIYTPNFAAYDPQMPELDNACIKNKFDKELYDELTYTVLPRILHDVDRNSMARSLEVRLPFLDYRLVELAFALPPEFKIHGSWTKYVVRKALKRYLPKKIYSRKQKLGFPAPFATWLRDPKYQQTFAELIQAFKSRGIIKSEYIDALYGEHMQGHCDRSYLLFHIVSLEIWLQAEIDASGHWTFPTAQVKE